MHYDFKAFKKRIEDDYEKNKILENFSFSKWKEEKMQEIELENKRDKKFVNSVLLISTIISVIFSFLILKYFGANVSIVGIPRNFGDFLMDLNLGIYGGINLANLEIKSVYYHDSKKFIEKFSLRFL